VLSTELPMTGAVHIVWPGKVHQSALTPSSPRSYTPKSRTLWSRSEGLVLKALLRQYLRVVASADVLVGIRHGRCRSVSIGRLRSGLACGSVQRHMRQLPGLISDPEGIVLGGNILCSSRKLKNRGRRVRSSHQTEKRESKTKRHRHFVST
jgi:hypothetical protein